jgi:hypothetical protein
MSSAFIRYESKNGIQYASVYRPKRMGKNKINEMEYLGRVVDKDKGIFKSKTRGTFAYSLESGYSTTPYLDVDSYTDKKEKLTPIFGDIFLFNEIIKNSGFLAVIEKSLSVELDTLISLVAHKILDPGFSYSYAEEWWEDSYAKFLYPKAQMKSQRISEFLSRLGEEENFRNFFHAYLTFLTDKQKEVGILIDSTGLPNDIKIPLTAVNNHNGVISNEARLILILDRSTNMPIYFRYVPGNIVDVSTLRTTLNELNAYGVKVNYAIMDAGYYSEDNIKELYEEKIPFVIRLVPNRKIFKVLINEHAYDLDDAKYMVSYRERIVSIKRVQIKLFEQISYAYVALDHDRHHDEFTKYVHGALKNKDTTIEEINEVRKNKGLFVLLSKEPIEINDILPIYYTRQSIEQVFDIGKNNADLLPLRVHSEETLKGRLLVSFLSTISYLLVNKTLVKTNYCAKGVFHLFKRLKCKVFDDLITINEPIKNINDVANILKITIPQKIKL